jgi:ABC-type multidrug transport system fused ATPase/permease subunit
MPYMLRHLYDPTEPEWWGWLYVVAIVVGQIFGGFFYYHAGFSGWRLAAKIRAVMIILTYKKSLKVKNTESRDTGRVVNMVSSDAQFVLARFSSLLLASLTHLSLFRILSDTFSFFLAGILSPIQLIVVTGLLIKEIYAYALIPLGVFVLSMPVSGIVSSRIGGLRFKQQQATDNRLKLIRELISAIRIVKYYAWEVPFQENINKYRDAEVDRVTSSALNRSTAIGVFSAVGPIGTALVFAFYSIEHPNFNVSTIMTSLSLLNLLRIPLQMLPIVFVFLSQYKIAFDRVRQYALLPELEPRKESENKSSKHAIVMKKASIGWEEDKFVLEDLNLKVKKGEVVMIIGAVGSGKSSIASAVIGEASFTKGDIDVNGSLAYVPQDAWIINATVRDNIVFGNPWDEQKYKRVLKLAALETDLKILSKGDLTDIGDKGINLSGGQRQRVSIARSLYADRDIYVFDDPLSAVDSHVAAHLVEHAITKFIKGQGKTGFIVTNQIQFLRAADRVVLLKGGKIAEQGTFDELAANGKEFAQLIKDFGVIDEDDNDEASKSEIAKKKAKKGKEEDAVLATEGGAGAGNEEREQGAITAKVYWYYVKSGGVFLFLISILLLLLLCAARVFASIWLSDWSDPVKVATRGWETRVYLGVYLGATFFEVILFYIRLIPIVYWSKNASLTLHRGLTAAVVRASTSFFDITPMGRLLSRFSKDINLVDDLLALQFDQYIMLIVTLLQIFAQMATSQPYMLIAVGAGAIIFLVLQRFFQRTAIEIQRIEAVSRAPIFSHLTETIEGASSIRAYKVQKRFIRSNMNKVNANIIDFLSLRYSTGWFGQRLDWIGTVILFTMFLAIFLTRKLGGLDVALAGLSMSSASSLTLILSAVANNGVELETKMNSVERIRQYMAIEQEAPAHIPEKKPPASWPEKGQVTFKNLSIAYKNGPRVLKDVSLKIKPHQKIGIVGRTGAGKSTLITALFRMVEPVEGSVEIDGVDIGKLGLFDLRSKLAIIPQLPQLFIGTVRYNIDPFNEATDDQIWRTLEMVQLRDYIEGLEGKLDGKVEENGSNFSQGQRQLLSMARALVRNASVLLLDEATASVDSETDNLIQKMVRKNFKNTTVLTIAHRLNTIMDYDRVLVLDKGELAEYDSPKNLLANPKGIFTSMVDATGPGSAEHLRKIANGEVSVVEEMDAETEATKSKKSKKSASKSPKGDKKKAPVKKSSSKKKDE